MAQSLADKYRRHRAVMELALELRVTPREAEAVLAQRAARARWEETHARLTQRMETCASTQVSMQVEANTSQSGSAAPARAERPVLYWQQGSMA